MVPARAAVDVELDKLAVADVSALPITDAQRTAVRAVINRGFVSAFRRVMVEAAGLALLAGVLGALVPRQSK